MYMKSYHTKSQTVLQEKQYENVVFLKPASKAIQKTVFWKSMLFLLWFVIIDTQISQEVWDVMLVQFKSTVTMYFSQQWIHISA